MNEVKRVKTKEDIEIIVGMAEGKTRNFPTRDKIWSEIAFDGYMYYAAFCEGLPCAFCAAYRQDFERCIVLRRIYVKKGYADKNIYEALIGFLVEEHKEEKYEMLVLYANKKDKSDIAVYNKLGFVHVNVIESEEYKMAYKIQSAGGAL